LFGKNLFPVELSCPAARLVKAAKGFIEMSDSFSMRSSGDSDARSKKLAARTGYSDIESIESLKGAIALEGLLRKIGQDCCEEPLQYLERTQAWQQGE
jgi:hypothetical protein